MPDDEESDEIVVTGRRGVKAKPFESFAVDIDIDTGGTFDNLTDGLPESLRALLVNETDFDVDETLTAKQKEIVVRAIQGIANHPLFGEVFRELLAKRADINIVATNRSTETYGAKGATVGLEPDGSVSQGAIIDIIVLMIRGGEPVSNRNFAETVVHELIHALGIAEFSDRLDAPGSLFDREITNDIFRDYDFNSGAIGQQASETIIRIGGGSSLSGTPDRDVLAGSNRDDVIAPGAGGDLVFSGIGNDSIALTVGGIPDLIVDDGGSDRIVLPGSIDPAAVKLRWSDDGQELALLVNGLPEAIVQNAQSTGAIEVVQIGSVSYPISSFESIANSSPAGQSRVIEYFGAFSGGYIGSAASTDPDNDALSYQLVSISGEFADRSWHVDPSSGSINAQFSKPDETGSRFTTLIIRVSDGLNSVDEDVVVRWAYSLEQNPEL